MRDTGRHRTVEDQLKVLEACGITPSPGVELDHLFESFSREDLESEPFMLLLCVAASGSPTSTAAVRIA